MGKTKNKKMKKKSSELGSSDKNQEGGGYDLICKDQQEEGGYDLISELPDEIFYSIIFLLPIKEAVRSSILSSNWRYKWTGIFDVNIDKSCFTSTEQFTNLVDHLGRSLKGPITSCQISLLGLSNFKRPLDRFLESLTLKGIQTLVLRDCADSYLIPRCIYSCNSIRVLELEKCDLRSALPYLGLTNLRILNLGSTFITNNTVQKLLSHCVHLETLGLLSWVGLSNLKICSSSLKTVILADAYGMLKDLSIDAPNLERLNFCDYFTYRVQMQIHNAPKLQFIGVIDAKIRLLELGSNRFEYSSTGMPCMISSPVYTVTKLFLKASFDDHKEAIVITSLLRCFPCLEHMYVYIDNEGSYAYWETHGSLGCLTNHLKSVHLVGFNGGHTDVEFARYLLRHSKFLQKMCIICRETCRGRWEEANLYDFMWQEKVSSTAIIQLVWSYPRFNM